MKTYTIKPLEFEQEDEAEIYFAQTEVGDFSIWRVFGTNEWFYAFDKVDSDTGQSCISFERGEEICSSEYRRRLEACLVEVPHNEAVASRDVEGKE